jgi:hypothetical protein
VLAIVDFDLWLTYVSIGQPGSMHVTSVLFNALGLDADSFPHHPLGKKLIYCHVYKSIE